MTASLVAVPPSNPSAGSIKAMLPDASRNAHPLAVNDPLQWNDVLQTDARGRVRAVLNDGSILSLGSNSQLKIVQHDAGAQQTVIDLDYGKLRNQVTKITQPQGKYQVKTSNAVIGVIGTDFYVGYVKGRTTVICYEGQVSITPVDNSKVLGSTDVPVASDGSVVLHGGQIAIFGPKIARSETLLYPVLMEAGWKDTDVTAPGAQESDLSAGSTTVTHASQDQPGSKNSAGNSPVAGASSGGAQNSTVAQASQSSKNPADNSQIVGAPTGGAVNSTVAQASQSSKNTADNSQIATASKVVAKNSSVEQVSQSSKDIAGASQIDQANQAPKPGGEPASGNGKPQTPEEAQLVQLINQTRAAKALPPLNIDPRLAEVARQHTLLMVENGVLSHQFPGEPVLLDRFDAVKLPADYAAENIAWDTTVISAHQSLVNDPPHLRNILSAQANLIGVAVIRSGNHLFITEDFARVIPPDAASQ